MPGNSQVQVIDTITAQATPPGKGGVGVIRVSGLGVKSIAKAILGLTPKPRYAHFASFMDGNKRTIDQGIALYFPRPNSFTGEDVLELHAHGGPVVLDCILRRILELGARLARPGEFSERAFLNGKIDLAQAEAISDLINASSSQAASFALRSLQGEFSERINKLAELVINLRMHVEAAIDFSDEEIDFISTAKIRQQLDNILVKLTAVQNEAEQGKLLQEGVSVVIAGKPNVGKSSLLNRFCGQDSAIVTNIPGTTRDILREYINIDGLPLHIIDTAGLRVSSDEIEQEGIKRTWRAIEQADFVLLVADSDEIELADYQQIMDKLIILRNKIDLIDRKPQITNYQGHDLVNISVKTGEGLALLRNYLKSKSKAGFNAAGGGKFIARRRHLEALMKAEQCLLDSKKCIENNSTIDMLAEDLRRAQNALNSITGEFYTEDLLGRIFSEFCIGK